ncbi:MAG: UDP-2,3-diacylglucosamine diphosphatase [Tannerella sp.]|jgi:UDP-2,3-diacylglucosamine hydrolase|nr:UDP-2,3-diacylglucosamine diphosphatase [Tannerella sp.]
MEGKKIYFLSDIHLGNKYSDNPLAVEKKLVRWLDGIKDEACAIYFLGDVFDYWYEYKYIVPRGHVRFLGKLAELSDKGIEIHLFTGNHDIWMFDYLPKEIGAVIHRQPLETNLFGRKFFLGHGDETGYRPFKYRMIQSIFQSRICQILYASIHPRWTFAFAHRWSLSSRISGLKTEKIKIAQKRNLQYLKAFALSYLETHQDVSYFIFGHLHILVNEELTPTSNLVIIGDWMQHFSYAVWDGEKIIIESDAEAISCKYPTINSYEYLL